MMVRMVIIQTNVMTIVWILSALIPELILLKHAMIITLIQMMGVQIANLMMDGYALW